MQYPVSQGGGFAAGQLAAQAQGLGPAEQVAGGEGEFEPDLVLA